MEEQPFVIKVIIGFIAGGLVLLLFMGILLRIMLPTPKEEFLMTEQGDTLEITFFDGNPQIVSIQDQASMEAGMISYDLCFTAADFANCKDVIKNVSFIKKENNCSYYEINGKSFVIYSPSSPHVITEDGHWYQIRYIDTYDRWHCRYSGVRLYIVEYAYEASNEAVNKTDQALTIAGFVEIGRLEGYPEISEFDLIESLEQPIRDLEQLKEQIVTSPFLQFKKIF